MASQPLINVHNQSSMNRCRYFSAGGNCIKGAACRFPHFSESGVDLRLVENYSTADIFDVESGSRGSGQDQSSDAIGGLLGRDEQLLHQQKQAGKRLQLQKDEPAAGSKTKLGTPKKKPQKSGPQKRKVSFAELCDKMKDEKQNSAALEKLEELKKQREELAKEKKKHTADMRREKRRLTSIRNKAARFSNNELMEVFLLRKAGAEKKKSTPSSHSAAAPIEDEAK